MRSLLILLLLNTAMVYSQSIAGYVFDEKSRLPLEGAFVYFDGTTIGTNTNSEGYFTLPVQPNRNLSLIVKFLGFETFRVTDPQQYVGSIKITLSQDALALNEVVINKKGPFTRKEMLRAFRKHFLGDHGGSHCKILNEDAIYLRFDSSTNTLTATTAKPLIIINSYLNYQLTFDLESFEANYSYATLSDANLIFSSFSGATFFKDLSENGKSEKKRREAFIGSPLHFMRSIANGGLTLQKYQLYADRLPVDFHQYFKVSDTAGYKKVEIIDIPDDTKRIRASLKHVLTDKKRAPYQDVKFTLMRNGREQTVLNFNEGYFYIDTHGLFFPMFEITFAGYMGGLKAGDLLPTDYDLKL